MADLAGKIKSDHLTRGELFFCALAAAGLHLMLVFLFSKEQSHPVEISNQDRTNILFSADDPRFSAIRQKINAEQDPAEFIRGGDTGYSSAWATAQRLVPESKKDIPALPIDEYADGAPDTIKVERSYADMLTYSAPIQQKVQVTQENVVQKENIFPLWKDAYGTLKKIGDTYEGYGSAISINSNTVIAPTVLKIQFPPKEQKNLPIYITVSRSCGDKFLDQYAKRVLQQYISNPAVIKKFDPEYNDRVFVYWQPQLPPAETSFIPDNMFPEGEKQ